MPFQQREQNGLVWFTADVLNQIPHGFSTRRGGVSPAPWDSLNLRPAVQGHSCTAGRHVSPESQRRLPFRNSGKDRNKSGGKTTRLPGICRSVSPGLQKTGARTSGKSSLRNSRSKRWKIWDSSEKKPYLRTRKPRQRAVPLCLRHSLRPFCRVHGRKHPRPQAPSGACRRKGAELFT